MEGHVKLCCVEQKFPSEKLMLVSWKTVHMDNKFCLIKALFQDSSYEILFTIFATGAIFYERLSSDDILDRNKKLNTTIEMPVSKLLQYFHDLIMDSPDGAAVADIITGIHPGLHSLKLTSSFTLAGVPFLWEFNMSEVNSEVFSEHLTKPLMMMCSELLRQQHILFSLLHSKDRELDDLKSQAIQATRKKRETKLFDETAFSHERESSPGREDVIRSNGKTAFSLDGQKLYENIAATLLKKPCKETPSTLTKQNRNATDPSSSSLQSGITAQQHHNEILKSSPEKIDSEEVELQRRQELEKRFAERDDKETKKKKKKLKL